MRRKARLNEDLTGEHDDMVAMEMAAKYGRPFTVEEVIELRRRTVQTLRDKLPDDSFARLSDRDLYEAAMLAAKDGDEDEEDQASPAGL